jgi:hypothetical protein
MQTALNWTAARQLVLILPFSVPLCWLFILRLCAVSRVSLLRTKVVKSVCHLLVFLVV